MNFLSGARFSDSFHNRISTHPVAASAAWSLFTSPHTLSAAIPASRAQGNGPRRQLGMRTKSLSAPKARRGLCAWLIRARVVAQSPQRKPATGIEYGRIGSLIAVSLVAAGSPSSRGTVHVEPQPNPDTSMDDPKVSGGSTVTVSQLWEVLTRVSANGGGAFL